MNYDPNKAIRQALMVARRQITAPSNMTIRGQEHVLAYITPREAELLAKRGGSGRITKYGIPAFDDGDGAGGGDAANSEASTQDAAGGNAGEGAGPTGAGAGSTGEVGPEDTDVSTTATSQTAPTAQTATAPFGTQGFGQAPSAFGMGAIGTMAGLGLGVPGLGAIGTTIGTGLDVEGLNSQLGMMGLPQDISYEQALAHNLSLGMLGKSATEQFGQTLGFDALAEAPMSAFSAPQGLPDAPADTSGGPSAMPIIQQPQQNPMEDAEAAQQQALMASGNPMQQPLMLASGGAADGGQIMPQRDLDADPAVRQALDITRRNEVSPVAAARSVALGESDGGQDAPAHSEAGPEAGGFPLGRSLPGSEAILPSSHQAPLEGLPSRVKVPLTGEVITAGPNHMVRGVAEQYMRDAGMPYNPPKKYAKVDAGRAKRIADEYERMADDPDHPLVKAAYDALIKETMAQYQAAKAAGFKAEFWDPEKERDPYEASPRMAIEDVNKNHHMYVFPTYFGYGSKEVPEDAAQKNPLLADSGERWNGYPVTVNDIFRAVHDYFGHAKEGVGFRHDGEENAWRSHASMYSPLARLVMTSETRGQNSWLNFGPHGEKNRNARTEDTIFADQKIGVMAPWTTHEGAEDFLRPEDKEAMEMAYRQYRKARGGSIGYAAGGMPGDDPMVQQALDITRQAQPSAPDLARQVQPQAMPAMQSKPIETEDHPAWIPTRLITSKKAVATPGQKDIVDLESMRQTPKLYQQNVDLVRAYPNMPASMADVSHDEMADHFVDHVKDNLLALHDAVPEEIRNRSKLWYDGARNIVDRWSKKYGLPDHSIAASLAALSPQKDWYQNVSLAERVLEAMRGQGGNFYRGFTLDKGMENTFRNIEAFNKPKYDALWGIVKGKSLSDLDRLPADEDTKAAAKALWIRLHDETYNDRAHSIVTPEGNFGDFVKTQKGENAGTGWGSLTEIGKAIRSIEAARNPELISSLMGEKHKVRNFYNNILAPRSPHGDVTIDTHAVAAGLYRPLSGNSLEVAHNFANYAGKGMPSAAGSALTGIQGTYPLYAEAYRRAAEERGILPREMQSITWEAVRGLFPDTFKTAANNKKIDAVWNRYKNAEISQQDARGLINEITGGIRNPSWVAQGGAGPNEIGQPSDEPRDISGIGIRRPTAEGIERGRGGKPAAPVPARSRGSQPSPKIEEAASGGSIVDRALRMTSSNRPMVALADLFQRQLRGK